jgi:hypothetical protein
MQESQLTTTNTTRHATAAATTAAANAAAAIAAAITATAAAISVITATANTSTTSCIRAFTTTAYMQPFYVIHWTITAYTVSFITTVLARLLALMTYLKPKRGCATRLYYAEHLLAPTVSKCAATHLSHLLAHETTRAQWTPLTHS